MNRRDVAVQGMAAIFHQLSQWNKTSAPHRLLAMIHFGSTARGIVKPATDIDVLCIFNSFPAEHLEKRTMLELFEANTQTPLKTLKNEGLDWTLSVLPRTQDQLEYFSPLFLDLALEGKVVLDSQLVGANFIASILAWQKKHGAYKTSPAEGGYWMLSKNPGQPGLQNFSRWDDAI